MGYRPKRTVFRLIFEDEEFDGLEVRAHAPNFGLLEDATDLVRLGKTNVDDLTEADLAQLNGFMADFATHIVSWNVEDDDGAPVPATLAGLRTQELGFVFEVMNAWLESAGSVPAPLSKPSSGGRPSLEGSLPMEPLSPNPTSWSGQSLSSAAVSGSGSSPAN